MSIYRVHPTLNQPNPRAMWSPEPADYVCHGVRVRSEIELGYPRVGESGNVPAVNVGRGTVEVPAPGLAADREADFFVQDGSLILAVRGVGRFRAEGGAVVTVDPDPGASAADIRLYLSGSVLGAIWLQRGRLPLHASTVRLPDGGCAAFVGPSGAGKSSIAAHFAHAGYPLVADDVSVLTESDGRFAVWPGPPRVKLAPDALDSLDRSAAGLRHTGGTREKYHLELEGAEMQPGAPVPLRGIFLLSWGSGAPVTQRLRGLDAVDVVAGHTYRQEFVRPLGLEKQWLGQVARVARNVPTVRLVRPRGYDRSAEVIATVKAAVDAQEQEDRSS